MTASAILIRVVLGASVAAGVQGSLVGTHVERQASDSIRVELNSPDSEYAKLPPCAPIKGQPAVRSKIPDVLGAAPSTKTLKCFKKSDVSAGQKLLQTTNFPCIACHATGAEWDPTTMILNLRAQGDGTLSQANINAINQAHLEEMLGSVPTAKQLKQLRAYLKTKFKEPAI